MWRLAKIIERFSDDSCGDSRKWKSAEVLRVPESIIEDKDIRPQQPIAPDAGDRPPHQSARSTRTRFSKVMPSSLLNVRHDGGDLPRSDSRGDSWKRTSEEAFPAPEDIVEDKDLRLQQQIARDAGDGPPRKSARCAHGRKNCATCSHAEELPARTG